MLRKLITAVILAVLLAACNTSPPRPTTLEPEANYWQRLGTVLDINLTLRAANPSLAVDSSGNPVVSWEEDDGTSENIYVKRWNGNSWVQMGSFLDVNTNQDAYDPSLVLDSSGNPVVSWTEYDGTSYNIYVKRWDGSSWQQLGTFLDANTDQDAAGPSIALDVSGNPLVSWEEDDGTSDNIYVKRWDGTSWIQLGTFLDVTNQLAAYPSLALDSSGCPVVSWDEWVGTSDNIYVKRWNGTTWIQLGTFLDVNVNRSALFPSLTLDTSGNPIVTWYEWDGTSANIYVKHWTGSSWVQLGGIVDVNTTQDANHPSIALDSSGNPLVSWSEYDGTSWNIYVKRWTGSSWVQLGGILDINSNQHADSPSLALDSSGNPLVSWSEYDDDYNGNVYVKKYITNSWQDVGGILDIQRGQSAVNSSIARRSDNNPVVAWDEADEVNGSRNVYVKQWSGSNWIRQGGALDKVITQDAENPSVALQSNNHIHVVWQENGNIYESYWNNTAWIPRGTANGGALDTTLANEAVSPSMAILGNNLPVVAFAENGNILAKRLMGNTWMALGGTLDVSLSNEAYRPFVALKSDNNPIVAWYEDVGTSFNIYAKEWTGTVWVALGSAIDKTTSRDAKDIVLAIRTDNKPVVAWEEAGNIYVKRWTGISWVSLGGVLDKISSNEALRPAIDLRTDNNPIVTWQEWNGSSYDVFVKRWTGSSWVQVAVSAVDKTLSRDAQRPAIVLKSDNNPILSWDEEDGISENILVRQF